MADYWKSQPRKFCQYCKCWIADNKPSIEFHERGKNHKENVAAKISEIKKKSVQKAKQDERMCKQFAAMEEAAMKAYEEDLKRMEREATFGPGAETTTAVSTYQPVPTVQPPKKPQSNKQESKQKKPQKKTSQPRPPLQHPQYPPHPLHSGAALWVEGKSSEGYTYYYNTVTGESRWNKPKEVKGEAAQDAPPGSTQTSSEWKEAVSPEGHTYYYNTATGASSWEKPVDYTPKEAPGSSEHREGQEEPSNTEKAKKALEEEETTTNEEPSTQTESTEQGRESSVPKIQFRKRKAEVDSPETTEAAEETKDSEGDKDQEENGTAVSEMKEEETQDETPIGRFRPPNPYGTWERIKVQKDPYANVDWQLPQVQGGEDPAAVDLPPEPKHKFKTRVITSLGDSVSSTGPVAFKKKKTQNCKSRSLRQRDEDD